MQLHSPGIVSSQGSAPNTAAFASNKRKMKWIGNDSLFKKIAIFHKCGPYSSTVSLEPSPTKHSANPLRVFPWWGRAPGKNVKDEAVFVLCEFEVLESAFLLDNIR